MWIAWQNAHDSWNLALEDVGEAFDISGDPAPPPQPGVQVVGETVGNNGYAEGVGAEEDRGAVGAEEDRGAEGVEEAKGEPVAQGIPVLVADPPEPPAVSPAKPDTPERQNQKHQQRQRQNQKHQRKKQRE